MLAHGTIPPTAATLLVVTIAALVAAPAGANDGLAEARTWIERLEAPDASPDEVRGARARLAKLASGVIEDPATREASFALARSGGDTQAIMAATSLFPDDPRTPDLLVELARMQTEAGDSHGAYLAYRQLLKDPARQTPEILTEAGDMAARAGDMATAFLWSQLVNPDELSPMDRLRLHLVRLKSAAALSRTDVALESAAILGQEDLETLNMDPVALLAAARVHDAAEQTDVAIRQYEMFVNIHAASPHRPQALLSFGLLLARTGRVEHAKRVYRWTILEHPGTEAADFARLELLEVDGKPVDAARIAGYMEAARLASDSNSAAAILDRFVERYLAAGLPLEAFTALAGLATDGMVETSATAVAGQMLETTLEPVLRLLASRDDHVSVAAVAALAGELKLRLPRSQRQAVQTARANLGLSRLRYGALAGAIEQAREEISQESWFIALGLLDGAFTRDREPWAPDVAQARKMMAECYWRLGKTREALIEIDRALESAFDLPTIRMLRVLRADVLFSDGELAAACDEYREAGDLGRSPWIEDQLGRCAAVTDEETSS